MGPRSSKRGNKFLAEEVGAVQIELEWVRRGKVRYHLIRLASLRKENGFAKRATSFRWSGTRNVPDSTPHETTSLNQSRKSLLGLIAGLPLPRYTFSVGAKPGIRRCKRGPQQTGWSNGPDQ